MARAVDVYTLDGEYGNIPLVSLGTVGVVYDWLGVLDALLVNQIGAGGGARGSGSGASPLDQAVVSEELIVRELEDDRTAGVDIRWNLV